MTVTINSVNLIKGATDTFVKRKLQRYHCLDLSPDWYLFKLHTEGLLREKGSKCLHDAQEASLTRLRETEIVRESPQVIALLLPHSCSCVSVGCSVPGPPCFLILRVRELQAAWAERKHSPTVKCLQSISTALPQRQRPAHKAEKFCTAARDDTSGKGQKNTSSHCTLLCDWGLLSGEERPCFPFVFTSNCLNPCSFHREAVVQAGPLTSTSLIFLLNLS